MPDQTLTYISSRNRELSRRAALSLEETAARPVPVYIPGQLSLWIESNDYPGVVGEILQSMHGDFTTWRPIEPELREYRPYESDHD